MEFIIETNNLTKRYGTATVVDEVNLHVPKGMIYGLLGRNGAGKTKGFVAPMIGSAVMVTGSAALANQEWGAIYPWTATFFLVQGKIESTGYPTALSVGIILLLSAVGFFMTYHHFKKEDLK